MLKRESGVCRLAKPLCRGVLAAGPIATAVHAYCRQAIAAPTASNQRSRTDCRRFGYEIPV